MYFCPCGCGGIFGCLASSSVPVLQTSSISVFMTYRKKALIYLAAGFFSTLAMRKKKTIDLRGSWLVSILAVCQVCNLQT